MVWRVGTHPDHWTETGMGLRRFNLSAALDFALTSRPNFDKGLLQDLLSSFSDGVRLGQKDLTDHDQ